MPMPAMMMRSLGGTRPSRPNTDAGTMVGAASAAAVALRKVRRVGLLLFFMTLS